MLLKVTIVFFIIFIVFQLLYIFIPLFTVKPNSRFRRADSQQGISVLIPAYNEELIILRCIQGIVHVDYKNYEAIFVNDGSTDRTMDVLHQHLQLEPAVFRLPAVKIPHQSVKEIYQSKRFPQIFVIDKENGGKADALNAGTEYARKEIVVTLDADSVLDSNALHAVNAGFEDNQVIAAGGTVHIGQGYSSSITQPMPTFRTKGIIRFQIIQYITAFYLHKFTQARLRSITVIAGAFGAFRRSALFEVDGYRRTVGEDMDITLRIQRLINCKYSSHKLVFIPQAVCYTECPATLRDLFRQRIRWQKAFVDCIFMYRKAFFKQLGMAASIYLLIDSLALGTLNAFPMLFIPVSILINLDNLMIACGLFTISFFLANYQSITALIVSHRFGVTYSFHDYLRIVFFIPVEIVSYRLLGIFFVICGTYMYFRNRNDWTVSNRIPTTNPPNSENLALTDDQAV
ncbi:glycosyltransferase [Sediminibacillus dalangtanensis]|uniref:Glycosyltransferase n=1 Tax=Sediminibacillus dalangtanensis TaxID=2729421 RepID=A0ABX7VUQ5_9BACI|nr:glycosyltransferase family 2 protein [Sediminibacillus dalangtanensis]QTM99193.1 glycosyltransferase [Sediminibacillus dalangtanensis]